MVSVYPKSPHFVNIIVIDYIKLRRNLNTLFTNIILDNYINVVTEYNCTWLYTPAMLIIEIQSALGFITTLNL